MSSTNRSKIRNPNDYYTTPVDAILTFLRAFQKVAPGFFEQSNLRVLDPSAGGDSHRTMSYPTALEIFSSPLGAPKDRIETMDIRASSKAKIKIDYLKAAPYSQPWDLIITNPPFQLALPFIQKALREIHSEGYVVMLCRLNFFGSQVRFPFWQAHLPKFCFVHHKRMSFTLDGKTDSIEYCHLIWQGDRQIDFTQLKVI